MDISIFLQEDMVEFLDKQVDHATFKDTARPEEDDLYSINRDYAEEIKNYLDKNNMTEAKNVFDDLRKQYNESLAGSSEREKIYSILKEVYKNIKEYLKKHEKNKDLAGTVKEFKDKGLDRLLDEEGYFKILDEKLDHCMIDIKKNLKDKKVDEAIANYHILEGLVNEVKKSDKKKWEITISGIKNNIEILKKEIEKDKEKEEENKNQLDTIEKLISKKVSIQKAIKDNDLTSAINYYREFKKLFVKTDIPHDKKKFWHDQGLELYDKIRNLKNNDVKDSTIDNLTDIKNRIRKIISFLDEKDTHSAESLLIDVRHSITHLDSKYDKDKSVLESIISNIVSRIQFIKARSNTQHIIHKSDFKKSRRNKNA
jgi:hypothetical protein